MPIIHIDSINTPGTEVYASLTEAQLRSKVDPAKGIFIAESPKVIKVALDAGYQPLSMLCEERHIAGDAAEIIARCGNDLPIYTGSREVLGNLTGYVLTRGVLCAMRRPEPKPLNQVLQNAKRIVVVHGVVDSTNVGAIFRAAAALGIDAVLMTTDSCDPLNRRAIRVSMGSVFLIPWTWMEGPVSQLHSMGFATAAMALTDRSVPLDHPTLLAEERLAIVMGTEGDGLPQHTIDSTTYVVRIPMRHGVDSLNVASAAAVAFWELREG